MNSVEKAADRALELLRQGQRGLAIYKAAEEHGFTPAAVAAELLHRKKVKKAAREKATKGTGRKYYWQEKED